MPGYKDWIDAIDIKVDYFSAFMKAWIAFNAWYNSSGEVSGKTDKECIEFIASQSNRFKTYMTNLIDFEDANGNTYRESIANLHGALLNAAITTAEYIGMRQAVSFAEVAVKNMNAQKQKDHRQYHYKCYKEHGKIKTIVTKNATGVVVFSFEQESYDIEVLRQQSAFISLTQTQKQQCENCYKELIPYHVHSILYSGSDAKKNWSIQFYKQCRENK